MGTWLRGHRSPVLSLRGVCVFFIFYLSHHTSLLLRVCCALSR